VMRQKIEDQTLRDPKDEHSDVFLFRKQNTYGNFEIEIIFVYFCKIRLYSFNYLLHFN
jgi:hypothetical protein